MSFAITAVQVIFVLQFLLSNKIDDAVYWHFIFMITSFAVSGVSGDSVIKTGYFSTKIVGPVTLSYVIAIILFVVSLQKRRRVKLRLFEKMQTLFLYYLISGLIFGSIGCLFSDYFVNAFLGNLVYISMLLIHVVLLLNLYNEAFLKRCYNSVCPLLISALISTAFNWAMGISYEYSIYEVTLSSPVANFSILLIIYLSHFYLKIDKILIVSLLFLYLYILLLTGAPGKFFINVSIVGLVYILNRIKENGFGVIPAFVLVALALTFSAGMITENSLFSSKLGQFVSLGSMSSGSIENVESSPYIRVASMLNIYSENIHNPLYFVFGRGYGGYFQDGLHLFSGLDLSAGAFNDDAIRLGKYPSAHSTFNMVPLLHGFLGFYFLLVLVFKYFKCSLKEAPLSLVGVIWLLFMFYYGIQIGVIGVFLLFASEKEMKNIEIKKYNEKYKK